MTRVLVVTLLLTLAAGACGGEDPAPLVTPGDVSRASASPGVGPSVSAGASEAPSGTPAVTIERPADGSTVPTGELTVQVKVAGFEVVDKQGTPPAPGEGRLIYYVDVDFVPTEAGSPAHTEPGTFRSIASTTQTWRVPVEGKHALFVQLVNHNDTPLEPPVVAKVVVTASAGAASTAPSR
jgi:hypothetical protein